MGQHTAGIDKRASRYWGKGVAHTSSLDDDSLPTRALHVLAGDAALDDDKVRLVPLPI